jgi:hypothetical protein
VIDVAIILSVGGATGKIPAGAVKAMKMAGLTANVWTVIATIAMLRRVQAFDWWRAIFNYATSIAFGFLFVWLIKSYLFPLFTVPDLQQDKFRPHRGGCGCAPHQRRECRGVSGSDCRRTAGGDRRGGGELRGKR